jgi:hypothetical protein
VLNAVIPLIRSKPELAIYDQLVGYSIAIGIVAAASPNLVPRLPTVEAEILLNAVIPLIGSKLELAIYDQLVG